MRRVVEIVYLVGDNNFESISEISDAIDRVIKGGSCRSGNSFDVNFSIIFVGGVSDVSDCSGAATLCGACTANDRFFANNGLEGSRRYAALVAADALTFNIVWGVGSWGGDVQTSPKMSGLCWLNESGRNSTDYTPPPPTS